MVRSIQAQAFVVRIGRHPSCCYLKVMATSRFISLLLSVAIGFCLAPITALADVWMCAQEDGSYLFTDRGVAFCRIVEKGTNKNRDKEPNRDTHFYPSFFWYTKKICFGRTLIP